MPDLVVQDRAAGAGAVEAEDEHGVRTTKAFVDADGLARARFVAADVEEVVGELGEETDLGAELGPSRIVPAGDEGGATGGESIERGRLRLVVARELGLGLELERLSADDSSLGSHGLAEEHCQRCSVSWCTDGDFERLGEERVADEHRGGDPVRCVAARLSPAGGGVVEAGKIVVRERRGVDQLDGDRHRHGRVRAGATRGRDLQREERALTLSPADGVGHRPM